MTELIIYFILFLVLIIAIFKNTRSKLTKTNYIINTYLYVIVSLFIFIITNKILEKNEIDILDIQQKILPIFILSILLLFGILFTSPSEQLMIHLLWVGFIILMSVSGYPIYLLSKKNQTLTKVLLTLAVLLLGLSYIAYNNKLGYFDKWYNYLFGGLFALIVFQCLDLIFSNPSNEGFNNRIWYYSLFAVVLFSGFYMYDTQKLIKEGIVLEKICKKHLQCANYPLKSLNLYLDIINLFNNLVILNRN